MTRFTALVYSFVYVLALPVIVLRLLRSPGAAQLGRRFGVGLGVGASSSRSVWLHASSVGEVALLEPLVAELERRQPGTPLLITAFTSTGITMARQRFPAHTVQAFPFDLGFVIRRFMRRFRPRLVIVVESEFWPRFLSELHWGRVPVAVVNGKISERSLMIHRRTRFVAQALGSTDVIAMQDEANARRVLELGVSKGSVFVTGSMKYDLVSAATRAPARADLGIAEDAFVVVGGSLHAGEDEAFLDAVFSPQPVADSTAALLAPRYTETALQIIAAVRARGMKAVLKSELPGVGVDPGAWDVCVIDTLGELRALYALADAVFVGGSLYFRGSTKGGHNLMEPAIYGVPVYFGPYNHSFADTARALAGAGGGAEVKNAAELRQALLEVCGDASLAARMGQAARQVVVAGQGATARNLELIVGLLEQGSH